MRIASTTDEDAEVVFSLRLPTGHDTVERRYRLADIHEHETTAAHYRSALPMLADQADALLACLRAGLAAFPDDQGLLWVGGRAVLARPDLVAEDLSFLVKATGRMVAGDEPHPMLLDLHAQALWAVDRRDEAIAFLQRAITDAEGQPFAVGIRQRLAEYTAALSNDPAP